MLLKENHAYTVGQKYGVQDMSKTLLVDSEFRLRWPTKKGKWGSPLLKLI